MLDLREADPDMAMLEIYNALPNMLNYYFLKQGQYVPRHKDTLKQIRDQDPELAQMIHALFTAEPESRPDLALAIADRTIGTHRFFEYIWRDDKV
jgi:hypothetical protein